MFKIIILITKYKKKTNLTQKNEPLINELLRRVVRRVFVGLDQRGFSKPTRIHEQN